MDFKEVLENQFIRLNNDSSYLDFIDISVESYLIQFEKDGNELLDTILQDTRGSIIKLPLDPKDSITASFVLNEETNNSFLLKIKKLGFIQFNQNFIKQYDINKTDYLDQILNDILNFYSNFGIQLSNITTDCIKYNSESNNGYKEVIDQPNGKTINNENIIENQISRSELPNNNNSKFQRKWIIGIILVVISIIIYNLGKKESLSPTTLYNINKTTYVTTSKGSFDEMIRYINNRDEQALSSLMDNGQIRSLSDGTEVYLVSSHFSYCIIRLSGSTENLWVIMEDITKK